MNDTMYEFSTTKEHKPYGIYENYIKRPMDCICGVSFILLFWPLYLILAILVRIKMGEPVLFKQNRPGKDQKIFKLYKFRSMTDERDGNGQLKSDEIRLTKFGKWLRSTSLDELPEIFNIIKGEMSFVGPRPLAVQYLPYYTEEERRRHDVRPGLTGLAQINGRNTANWPERFGYDIDYVDHLTFKMDMSIILKTIFKVLKRGDITTRGTGKVMDFDKFRIQERERKMNSTGCTVKIRPLEKKDAYILMELNNNSKIARCVVGNPQKVTIEEQLHWMDKLDKEINTVRMMIDYVDKTVGTVIIGNIDYDNQTGNVNIKILPEFQGKGIGTSALRLTCQYAFDKLNLFCLTAHILSDNHASLALYEKIGFLKEGTLHSRVVKDGKRKDLISLCYLKQTEKGM